MKTRDHLNSPSTWRAEPPPDPWAPCTTSWERDPAERAEISERIARALAERPPYRGQRNDPGPLLDGLTMDKGARAAKPNPGNPGATGRKRDPSTRAAISEQTARDHPYGPRSQRDLTVEEVAWAASPADPAAPDGMLVSPLQQVALDGWWASSIRDAVRDSPTTRRNTRSTGRIGTVFHEMQDGGIVSMTRDGAVIQTTKRKPRRSRSEQIRRPALQPSQICASFQLGRGCRWPAACSKTHVCATCMSCDHGEFTCPRRVVGAESTPTGMAAETHRPRHFVGLGEMSLF
jgi:hypothetical protein